MRLLIAAFFFLSTHIFAKDFFPHEFVVKFKAHTKDVYLIETLQEELFGKVFRKEENGKALLIYQNLQQEVLAFGKIESNEDLLSIYDSHNTFLGSVVRKKGIITPASYQILSREKKSIAEGSMNWLGTRLALLDPRNSHREYVTLYRPYFRLPGDHWYVQIHREELDPRWIVLLGAFQTYIDKKNNEIIKNSP